MIQINPADLTDPRVIALLQTHVTTARAQTAPGSAHALDLDALRSPAIRVWTAWQNDQLVAIAARKRLSPEHGEIKSMHTAEPARRTGAGSALLRHLIATARAEGVARLSLETGTRPYFAPARAFYAQHGFVECPPFGEYVLDPNSVFMAMDLRGREA